MSLIVNPLASIERSSESRDLLTGGPVPRRGLDPLVISPAGQPHLYDLFSRLLTSQLSYLDPDTDLIEGETDLLCKHGVLIEEDNVPQRPLFSCMLGDVVPKSPTNDLIAALSLEFEPFDLTKFRYWINERHLSPHFASAWVTDPRTGIRWAYWLRPDEADVVSKLDPGSTVRNIDAGMLEKLYSARIVVDVDSAEQDADLDSAVKEFRETGYALIDDLVPRPQLKALQSYYNEFVSQGFMKFGDDQVPRRFIRHDEPVARMVLEGLVPLMSRLAGSPVRPTYSYSAVYTEGATLEPHIDRDDCEFSFSLQLDYSPDIGDDRSPWPLYVSMRPVEDVDTAVDTSVILKNGSCLVYKGRELVHYRTELPAGHRSTSLFFHYVPLTERS